MPSVWQIISFFKGTVKVKSLYKPWRHIRQVKVQFHSLLTTALDEGEWSASCSAALPPSPHYTSNRRLAGIQSLSTNYAEHRSLLRLLGFEPHIIQPLMKLHLLTKAIPAGKIQAHFNPHLKYQYGTLSWQNTDRKQGLSYAGANIYTTSICDLWICKITMWW